LTFTARQRLRKLISLVPIETNLLQDRGGSLSPIRRGKLEVRTFVWVVAPAGN
jgi:hypothetical protein